MKTLLIRFGILYLHLNILISQAISANSDELQTWSLHTLHPAVRDCLSSAEAAKLFYLQENFPNLAKNHVMQNTLQQSLDSKAQHLAWFLFQRFPKEVTLTQPGFYPDIIRQTFLNTGAMLNRLWGQSERNQIFDNLLRQLAGYDLQEQQCLLGLNEDQFVLHPDPQFAMTFQFDDLDIFKRMDETQRQEQVVLLSTTLGDFGECLRKTIVDKKRIISQQLPHLPKEYRRALEIVLRGHYYVKLSYLKKSLESFDRLADFHNLQNPSCYIYKLNTINYAEQLEIKRDILNPLLGDARLPYSVDNYKQVLELMSTADHQEKECLPLAFSSLMEIED